MVTLASTRELNTAAEWVDMLGAAVAAYESRRSTCETSIVTRNAVPSSPLSEERVRRVSLRGGFHRGVGRRLVITGKIVWEGKQNSGDSRVK